MPSLLTAMKRLFYVMFFAGSLCLRAEDFEGFAVGGFTSLESEDGKWTAKDGHAEIDGAHATVSYTHLTLPTIYSV